MNPPLSNFPQIHETIETINQLKTQREFMLSFARDPQGFINDWLQSQCRDFKVSLCVMTSDLPAYLCSNVTANTTQV